MYRRILAAVGALALTIPATAAMAAATPDDDPGARFTKATPTTITTDYAPVAAGAAKRVSVIVEMTGDPVAVVQADKGRKLSKAEKDAIKSQLKKQQDGIAGAIRGKGGRIEAQMQSAYNGIQLSIASNEVDALRTLPGVTAVHPTRTHSIDNSVSVPFLGVPEVWQSTGYTGENIKVAIIDTGIDYTHADFGGPGTVAAFDEAKAAGTGAANPAWFGPDAPRVKGGIDLVGDAYNANDPNSVPKPDDNPLDCQGHGSHVAGTAAGSGVLADGSTYTGPYDANTEKNSFKIGPGVAPQADLYAIRVFGCAGSTNVVVPAIDWAVDHGMDVINMSLGSDYGQASDADAVASANAVAAGVVVVAAAGNAGHNPYLVSSPGTGGGVVSVSAVDSTATFPGAKVALSGGASIEALNANGAKLDGLPAMTVVYLKDDPATAENEALGCSAAAYTSNGVRPGQNQIAVSQRGTCARVAKAIFAQQAGASGAIMVNDAEALPPYEGPITENPDDGTPFTVTIPFLGVPKSAGATLQAAVGQTATVTAEQIQNPGFRHYASFTSGGPRSGDSAIAPDVAAPGVSIQSVAVGSGTGAAIMSGTSMATPHVAGVAALAVQAHPGWSAVDVASLLTATADPSKVAGQDNTVGGAGLVDAAAAVSAQVTASGDRFRTTSGWATQPTLSFGYDSSTTGFSAKQTVTLTNHGTTTMTYKTSSVAGASSAKATVNVTPSSVTLAPGKSAQVQVTLDAKASAVGSSLEGRYGMHQFAGDVVFTAADSTVRVPYLLVPRADANVQSASARPFANDATTAGGTSTVTLLNRDGAMDADADFYTWGLSAPSAFGKKSGDTGIDLRAAGVQSFPISATDSAIVFAVNTYSRWSNPAANEFDVLIDTNGDGVPDKIVFAVDQGLVTAGSANGASTVFVYDVKTKKTAGPYFYATAPTDSSTILLPMYASVLGIKGAFRYTVQSASITDSTLEDAFAGWAAYDLTAPAISNGQYGAVPAADKAGVPFAVSVDPAAFATQKPLGSMVVVLDNRAGADEALLIPLR